MGIPFAAFVLEILWANAPDLSSLCFCALQDSPDFSPQAYRQHVLATSSLSGLVKASNSLTVGECPRRLCLL